MTRKEAKAYFEECNEGIITTSKDENVYDYEKQEIMDVSMRKTYEANIWAIKALSVPEREKGEWIRFQSNEFQPWHIRCSNCGQYWSIDGHAEIFKYCFNCGADMRNNNNDNH